MTRSRKVQWLNRALIIALLLCSFELGEYLVALFYMVILWVLSEILNDIN
jgi:hypothetical protein